MLNTKKHSIIGDMPFGMYLLSDTYVKKVVKDFAFYNVRFYNEMKVPEFTVSLEYPQGNMFWFLDFKKAIEKDVMTKDARYHKEWNLLFKALKAKIFDEKEELVREIRSIKRASIIDAMAMFNLYDYQACDLFELKIKMKLNNSAGLLLSEQRTGKTRIALASVLTKDSAALTLVICPKKTQKGWLDEINFLNFYWGKVVIGVTVIKTVSELKNLAFNGNRQIYIISYDLFKLLTPAQLKHLTHWQENDSLNLILDEAHRLRNFKTMQSSKIFDFKDMYSKHKTFKNIVGLTGTPAIRKSEDVFGSFCLINNSKIGFKPTIKDFCEFKDYFYVCVETSYGKIPKGIKRTAEMNYLQSIVAVQTRQADLELFKNYKKEYKKVELNMDDDQILAYNDIVDLFEYENIDCKNKLVQTMRLQQICTDPTGLLASYVAVAPKIKWCVLFAEKYKKPMIIMSKRLQPLRSLYIYLFHKGIQCSFLSGETKPSEFADESNRFRSGESRIFLIQSDVGREGLTLPEAEYTIFLDRDYAQGYNEQAEARMTPIDGKPCTKYVIDLVMKNTIEEGIYDVLINRKEDIEIVNIVFEKLKKKGVE